jgi:hypothetical protein
MDLINCPAKLVIYYFVVERIPEFQLHGDARHPPRGGFLIFSLAVPQPLLQHFNTRRTDEYQ